jgi:hypothetical protein
LTRKEESQIVESLVTESQVEDLKTNLQGSRILKHCIQNAAGKKVDLIAEPMFSSVLYGLQLSSFLNLKKKARILVPDSATLIGVVDEDGILEEDEVFVQIRRDNFKE